MELISLILAAGLLQSPAIAKGNFVSTCIVRMVMKAPDSLSAQDALAKSNKRCECLARNMDSEDQATYVKMHYLSQLIDSQKKETQEIFDSSGGEKEFFSKLSIMGSRSELAGNKCDIENKP